MAPESYPAGGLEASMLRPLNPLGIDIVDKPKFKKKKIGSPQLRSWNCLKVLDQCSPRSLLATGDLVLNDVVLLTIRKQAFCESEIQPVAVRQT